MLTRILSARNRRAGGMLRSRDGAVVPIFALAVLPIIGFVGLAIDYGSVYRTKSLLKQSVDAATLAGLNAQAAGLDPIARVNAFLASQLAGTGVNPTVAVTPNVSDGTLTVTASVERANSLIQVLGMASTHIEVKSIAATGASAGGAVEVAIAFDTTGSMAGGKLTSAQAAANQLIDTLFAVPGSTAINPHVQVGLVPFAAYVNVGTQYRHANWLGNANDYSNTSHACWNTYPNATYTNPVPRSATCYNDGVPYTCTWTDWTVDYGAAVQQCGDVTDTHVWNGCVGSQDQTHDAMDAATGSYKVPPMFNINCAAPLIRLGHDPAVLKTAVNDMYAAGETYIAPGLLWAWRLLSPNIQSPFADGAAYGSAKKVMILLTDGANTHSAQYSNGDHEAGDVAAANAKVLETCANIKGTGIQLFTIAFDVTDATIQSVLAQCSSGPPYNYNAHTISDLQGAFQMIGSQLTSMRIIE